MAPPSNSASTASADCRRRVRLDFEFTEAQLYLATIGTLTLAAAFVGLALLFRPPFRRLTGEARAGHAQQNAPN